MDIQLKSIKHFKTMSEETEAYEASLYVNGKKIGTVSNRGHGGCDEFRGDNAAYKLAEEWVKENTPPSVIGETSYPATLEDKCGELLTDHLNRKELKTLLGKAVLFPDNGQLSSLSFKGVRKVTEQHLEYARKKHPNVKLLNDMDFEDAFKIFVEMTVPVA